MNLNQTKKAVLTALLLGSLITSCAHHRDVRAGVDGVHRIVIQTEGTEAEKQNAIDQANHFCKQQGKYAAFIDENQKYTGKVDEKTYNDGKTVGKVLTTVGLGASVFGGARESNVGGIGVLAGAATDTALGKGYTVEMKFKCQ